MDKEKERRKAIMRAKALYEKYSYDAIMERGNPEEIEMLNRLMEKLKKTTKKILH